MPAAIVLLILAAFGALVPHPAYACICGSRTPFCEKPPASSVSADGAVFLGTVESLDPAKGSPHSWLVRFRVDEAFVGTPGPIFELMEIESDCSIGFEAGKQYLVIAGRGKSHWSASGCSGTTTASYGKLEIDALRAWKRGQPTKPGILGSVSDSTSRPDRLPGEWHAAEGIKITLSGKRVRREARTAADGSFSFSGLARAQYKLQMAEPGWAAQKYERTDG